jgi:RNA polymerase sigma-70 factor (ECF subfamily)
MDPADWLERFHAGDRTVLSEVYREHFDAVLRTASRFLPAVDAEGVVHEVFYRLISGEAVRRSFQGGSLIAWLTTVTRNQAIDALRKLRREVPAEIEALPNTEEPVGEHPDAFGEEARRLIERFRMERLPEKWAAVFEARFLQGLSQREAAKTLGVRRTTLAYQEGRIRWRLRRFLLGEGGS